MKTSIKTKKNQEIITKNKLVVAVKRQNVI